MAKKNKGRKPTTDIIEQENSRAPTTDEIEKEPSREPTTAEVTQEPSRDPALGTVSEQDIPDSLKPVSDSTIETEVTEQGDFDNNTVDSEDTIAEDSRAPADKEGISPDVAEEDSLEKNFPINDQQTDRAMDTDIQDPYGRSPAMEDLESEATVAHSEEFAAEQRLKSLEQEAEPFTEQDEPTTKPEQEDEQDFDTVINDLALKQAEDIARQENPDADEPFIAQTARVLAGSVAVVVENLGNSFIDMVNFADEIEQSRLRDLGVDERSRPSGDVISEKQRLDFAEDLVPSKTEGEKQAKEFLAFFGEFFLATKALRTAGWVAKTGKTASNLSKLQKLKQYAQTGVSLGARSQAASSAATLMNTDADSVLTADYVRKNFDSQGAMVSFFLSTFPETEEGDTLREKKAKAFQEDLMFGAGAELIGMGAKGLAIIAKNMQLGRKLKIAVTKLAKKTPVVKDVRKALITEKKIFNPWDPEQGRVFNEKGAIDIEQVRNAKEYKIALEEIKVKNPQTISEAVETFATKLENAKDGTVSLAEVARDMGLDPEKVMDIAKTKNIRQVMADLIPQKMFLDNAAESVLKLGRAARKDPSDVNRARLALSLNKMADVAAVYRSGGSEFGRGLRFFQHVSNMSSGSQVADGIQLLQKANPELTSGQLGDMFLRMTDKELVEATLKTTQFMGKQKKRGWMEMFILSRQIGVLSRIGTQATNVIGTTTNMLNDALIDMPIAVAIDKTGKGLKKVGLNRLGNLMSPDEGGVKLGELAIQFHGTINATYDAITITRDAILKGKGGGDKTGRQVGKGFWDPRKIAKTIPPEEYAAMSVPERTMDLLQRWYVTSAPLRGLGGMDAGFKHANFNRNLNAMVYNEMHSSPLYKGMDAAKKKETIKNLLKDPARLADSEFGKLVKQAKDKSAREAFAGEFRSIAGKKMAESFAVKNPISRFMFFMFSDTPIKVFENGFERFPVLGLMMDGVQKDLKKGGRARQMVLARQAAGTAFMGAIGAGIYAGKITGAKPTNPEALANFRRLKKQENSIEIAGHHVDVSKIEPYASLFKFTTGVADLMGYVNSDSLQTEVSELFAAAVSLLGRTVVPEFLLQGTEDFGSLGDVKSTKQAAARVLGQTAFSTVPLSGFVQTITRATDPVKRQTRVTTKTDPDDMTEKNKTMFKEGFDFINTALNQILVNTPGTSFSLKPRLDVFAETQNYPEKLGPDFASPVGVSQESDDPAIQEMFRLGITDPVAVNPKAAPGTKHFKLNMPSRVFNMSMTPDGAREPLTFKYKLDNDQYNKLLRLTNGMDEQEKVFKGVTMKQALKDEIVGGYPSIKVKTDEMKKIILTEIVSKYQSAGVKRMKALMADDIELGFRAAAEARRRKLLGE